MQALRRKWRSLIVCTVLISLFAAAGSAAPPEMADMTGSAGPALVPLPPPPPDVEPPGPGDIDTGDTTWVILGAAMVLLMTPALALFYGGLVRRKNVLSVMMQCFMAVCLVTVQWVLIGYSLSFGPDVGGFIGDLSWAGLAGVGASPNANYAPTIPHQLFMAFQMMFAIITPALIIGAFAERMRFGAYCAFTLLWATLVYDPVTHWVWGVGGFLRSGGALDFAGGMVVHVTAGMSALAAALFMGKRQGFPKDLSPPHNLPLATLGAGMLWFGWFGFNGASALAANGVAVSAIVATQVSGAVAGAVWSLMDWMCTKKTTTLGMITGAVAGLAAVTPAAGFVTPLGAAAIGIGAGIIPWIAVMIIKAKFRYDDSLDAFGVHGIGGIWGTLATGLFATTAVNAGGADGLFYGSGALLWAQTKAVVITGGYSFIVTLVLLALINVVLKVRVSEHEERVGLDLTQHREAGYTIIN